MCFLPFPGKHTLHGDFLPRVPCLWGSFLSALALVSWVNQTQPSSELPSSGVTALHSSRGTGQRGLALSKPCVSTTILHAQVELYHPLFSVASPAQIPIAEVCLGLPEEAFSSSPACLAPAAYPCGFTCCLLFTFYFSIELLRLCSCVNILGEAYKHIFWPLTSYSYEFGAQEIGSWVYLLWDIYPEIFTPF